MFFLKIAASGGFLEVLRILVDNGVKLDQKDNLGRTSAHHAASNGHIEILRFIVEHGQKLDIPDNQGRAVVHYGN